MLTMGQGTADSFLVMFSFRIQEPSSSKDQNQGALILKQALKLCYVSIT